MSTRQHEDLYQRTVESFCIEARRGEFFREGIPHHVSQLREELAECLLTHHLISEEFHDAMNDLLDDLLLSPLPDHILEPLPC